MCFRSVKEGVFMYNKAFFIILLAITSIFSTSSLAKIDETTIAADSLIVGQQGILQARGNILIQGEGITIKADALQVNPKTGEIKFFKITEFNDENNIKFEAEEATIDQNLSDGIISFANILVEETIKIQADEVRLSNGVIESVKKINSITA